mgnify:FL=1
MDEKHRLALAAGNADVGLPGFAGAVDDTAHDSHLDGLFAALEPPLHLICDFSAGVLGAAAGRAGDDLRAGHREADSAQDIVACFHFLLRVSSQRDTDGVADPFQQHPTDAHAALEQAHLVSAGLRDAHMERVVGHSAELAVCLHHAGDVGVLDGDDDVVEVELFQQVDMVQSALHHRFRHRRAVLGEDVLFQTAAVDADADGDIFLLAGMFPLLVIGIFSIASVRKQMLARYESLEKADGLRVASSLNDITTTVYSSSDTLLNSNQCLSLFAAESLDSGIEEQLTALERALQTYFENTAAVARIQIYTNNPNLQNSEHIHYQQNFVLDEWRKTLGNNWSTWASLQRYTAIVRQPYRELTLIRRIGVASSKYQAFLVVGLDRNTIKNHLEQSSNETTISLDGTQIIYATDSVLIGKDMEFPDDFSGYIYRYTGPKEIGNQMRLVNYVTLQSYKSNNLFYVRTVDPDALKTINHTVAVFVLILVLALLVPLILMICFSDYFSTRITTLKSAMHRASLGDYNIIEQFRGDDELSDTFKDLKLTVDAIHDKEAQFYEARIREQQLVNRQQQMEFEMLASQINPHFLYNTLETIRMQALSCGNRNVATSIKLLGKSMRYVLDNTGTSFTTLTKELEYIKTYLSIQQLRFGDRVNYTLQVDEDLDTNSCKILPLLLQPVVENAILHGLESKTEDGMITIQIASADATLLITIKDNGQGMTNEELDALRDRIRNHPSSDTHSIGLYNINQRISLFYGEGYYMEIDSAIGAGTTVRLKIPKTI